MERLVYIKKEVLSPPLSKQIPIERKNGSFYNNNPTHPTDFDIILISDKYRESNEVGNYIIYHLSFF